MSTAAPEAPLQAPQGNAKPFAWLREHGMGASILIGALSTAFGVFLINATEYIAAWVGGSNLGMVGGIRLFLTFGSVVMVGLAMYVGAMATANTFSTIIAGRVRQIALMRLIESSARAQRRIVARQGLTVGVIGAILGVFAGVGISAIGASVISGVVAAQTGGALTAPEDFSVWHVTFAAPVIAVVLTTWIAAWVGSRRVLTVSPLEALGSSGDRSYAKVARQVGRHVWAVVLLAIGGVLLLIGILLGNVIPPFGFFVAFWGSAFSFTGIVIGSTLIMPPLLRGFGFLFGTSTTAKMAAGNALRAPERASRMSVGVMIGVALVVMFAVALDVIRDAVINLTAYWEDLDLSPEELNALTSQMDTAFSIFSVIIMGLVGVSAVIAGISLINLLTIGVVQRRRELGLLRAVGLAKGQIRRMVFLEALHIVVTATVAGLALGVFCGWAGAQSLFGFLGDRTYGFGWLAPSVPWSVIVVVTVATTALTLLAAVMPSRIATKVTPVEALHAD
ncbi:FtsX-like permease family protein [Auritidibacter ignavus]|uniref:FtsX-like permease family protein n=2 Tax=Micrococcaceae TaxID=1268 RepID=A0AAJ6ALG7_9MICC|nr:MULTISPECIES: FtsX-like permease family protein [Auritidibacter]WGH92260.1 FtsX-like permease family protein [Auritidibacter ignavus]